jgi:hypothetical protein
MNRLTFCIRWLHYFVSIVSALSCRDCLHGFVGNESCSFTGVLELRFRSGGLILLAGVLLSTDTWVLAACVALYSSSSFLQIRLVVSEQCLSHKQLPDIVVSSFAPLLN